MSDKQNDETERERKRLNVKKRRLMFQLGEVEEKQKRLENNSCCPECERPYEPEERQRKVDRLQEKKDRYKKQLKAVKNDLKRLDVPTEKTT